MISENSKNVECQNKISETSLANSQGQADDENKVKHDSNSITDLQKEVNNETSDIKSSEVKVQNEVISDVPKVQNAEPQNQVNIVDDREKEVVSEPDDQVGLSKTQNLDTPMQDSQVEAQEDANEQINGENIACSRVANTDIMPDADSQLTKVGADLIRKETSKLQFLLSQPDIFEYLRKMNNEELKDSPDQLNNIGQSPMDVDNQENVNKRHANGGKENESNQSSEGYDSEHVLEKLEVQPSNLVNGTLKPYQMDALNWLYSLHEAKLNGILADEMGLGKTIESISILALIESKKTEKDILSCNKHHIIIVPKVTIGKWK